MWNVLGLLLVILWFAVLNGWRPLVLILTAAALHEAGHWIVLAGMGAKPQTIRFSPAGAEMVIPGMQLSYARELAAVLAGPAANFITGAVILLCVQNTDFSCAAVGANLVLGIFNLLPVRPLDGGRALELIFCWALGPNTGETVTALAGTVCAGVSAVLLAALIAASRGNLWLVPPMVGMLAAALREGRLLRNSSFGKCQEEF